MANDFYGKNNKYPKLEKVKRIKPKKNKYTKIINIVFTIIVILIIVVVIDIVAVSKYSAGPFFAIKTKKYNDGGTTEYTGLFYKVIKYNQSVGRKDTEIGSWGLKYHVEPIDYSMLDLALDLNNNPNETYKNISKKFLRVSGIVKEVNKINNEVILQYTDEDGDYTLNLVCKMYSSTAQIENYTEGNSAVVIGSVTNFKMSSKIAPNTLSMTNCFIN